MDRRHRVIHLFSFAAIIMSLFSPVLTLPVIAEEPVPEPEVSLNQDSEDSTIPEEGTQEQDGLNAPVSDPPETDEVDDGNSPEDGETNEPELNTPPDEPVLTSVTPVFPTLVDSTCGDGVVFAQTATAPETVGVSYEIGAPDDTGNFTVTATLTDASVYAWADTGLDGWTVVDSTATASGTLALCPIPEPEELNEEALPDDSDAYVDNSDAVVDTEDNTDSTESGEIDAAESDGTAEADDSEEVTDEAKDDGKKSELDEEKPAEIATPGMNASSRQMAPNDLNGAELILEISREPATANDNDEIDFTIAVRNQGSADSGEYTFLATFSDQDQFAFKQPALVSGPDGSTCTINEGPGAPTFIHCTQNGGDPIPPGQSHDYTVTVVVNTDTCIPELRSRVGGSSEEAVWAEGYRIGGDTPQIHTSINCPAQEPTSLSIDLAADTPVISNPADRVAFTITVSNTGSDPVTGLTLSGIVPAAFTDDGWNLEDSDDNADCSIEESQGITGVLCQGMSVPAQVGDVPGTLTVNYSLAEGVTYPESACNEDHQSLANMQHASLDEGGVTASASVTIKCEPTLVQSVTADRTVVAPGGLVEYTISVENTSGSDFLPPADAGQFFLIFLVNQQHGAFEEPYVSSIPNSGCMEFTESTQGYNALGCYLDIGGVIEAGATETITIPVRAPAQPSDALCASGIETLLQTIDNVDPGIPGPDVALDCDPQLPELSISADTSVTDGEVDELTPFNYTVLVEDVGGVATTGFAFITELPAGFNLSSSGMTVPEGASCENNTSNQVTTIDCEGPGFGPDDEPFLFIFSVVADSEINTEICDAETSFTATGSEGAWGAPNWSTTPTFTVNCNAEPLLSVEFVADKTEAEVGDTINYTATITNDGTGSEGFFSFQAYISSDTTLLQDPPIVASDGLSCEIDEGDIVCEAEDFAPNDVHTLTYSVEITPDPSDNVCRDIGATFGFLEGAWDDESNQSADVDLLCPNLGISLTDNIEDGESVGLNEPFTYTVTLSNTGDSDKGEFAFALRLPDSLDFAPDFVLDGDCEIINMSGYTIVGCSGTDLPSYQGEGRTFDVKVVAVDSVENPACGTISAEAQITRGIWDDLQDPAEESTDIECISSVDFSIDVLNSPVVPGESIGFELTIENTGNTRITSLSSSGSVLPDLPGDAEWISSLTLNGVPVDGNTFPSALNPDDVVVGTLVSPAIPADLTLPESEWCKAWTMSSNLTAGFTWGNDQTLSDSATVQVNCTGLSIEQSVSSELVEPGGEVEYTINVTNNGNTTVSPLMVFHDATETGTVFSNWRVTGEGSMDCGLVEDVNPGCTYLSLDPQESLEITITGDAPVNPTVEQCAPVTSQAVFIYGEVLNPARMVANLAAPYTPVMSNSVTTQVDCEPGISVTTESSLDLGSNDRVDAGDVLTITLEVENTGNVPLYDIVVNGGIEAVEWDSPLTIAELAPGGVQTLTGTYTIIQADIDAGYVEGTVLVQGFLEPAIDAAAYQVLGFARAQVEPVVGESVTGTETMRVELLQEPGMELEFSIDDRDDVPGLGDTFTATVKVTNTGNVTLTDIELDLDREGFEFADGNTIASLAPGEEQSLTATYTITQQDIDDGGVEVCVTGTTGDEETCVTIDVMQPEPEVPETPPASPTPTDPVTPPASPTPTDPATPPASPAPTDPATQDDPPAVSGLPETGSGSGVWTSIVLMVAIVGALALGVGGAAIRRAR